jgi:hypothetical protein
MAARGAGTGGRVATAWRAHKTIAINGSIARRDGGAHTKVYGAALSAPVAARLHGF